MTGKPVDTLETLADAWAAAKREEDLAAKRRIEIEAEIIARAGERDEGSETHELADGRKLTVTAKITRSIDEDAWRRVMHQVPEQMRPITFVESAKLDTKGLHWLQDNEPAIYAIVAQAVTARKAKSSISVKVA
jgi:hypothetical protein